MHDKKKSCFSINFILFQSLSIDSEQNHMDTLRPSTQRQRMYSIDLLSDSELLRLREQARSRVSLMSGELAARSCSFCVELCPIPLSIVLTVVMLLLLFSQSFFHSFFFLLCSHSRMDASSLCWSFVAKK